MANNKSLVHLRSSEKNSMMYLLYKVYKYSSQLKSTFSRQFSICSDNEILSRIYKIWTEEEKLKLKTAFEKHKGNWIKIAEEVGTRNVQQCKNKFRYACKDNNYKIWTKEEDSKLISLVEKYGKKWLKIANHFPQRSYNSIYKRYTRELDPTLNKNELTLEEKQALRTFYKQYPQNWHKIAKIMNSGHSPFFLRDSFYKLEKDLFKKGKFTPEEDRVIIDFISKYGKRWAALGVQLNRFSNAIRNRYENVLNPELLKGKWTNEEEEHLLTYIKKYGKKWGIYSRLTNRSYLQIYCKYKTLVKRIANNYNVNETYKR